jgi:DNA-binding transcriptional regulator YiaG
MVKAQLKEAVTMDPSGLPPFAPEILSPDEIRGLRLRCKLTQQQLARKLNVRRETIVRWERGRQVPNPVYVELMRKIEIESLQPGSSSSPVVDSEETGIPLQGKCPICGKGPVRPLPLKYQTPASQPGTDVGGGILAYQCIDEHIFFVMAKDIKA